jgi:hypothetical protein
MKMIARIAEILKGEGPLKRTPSTIDEAAAQPAPPDAKRPVGAAPAMKARKGELSA